jgi:anti-sigma-K factor RskA
VCEVSQHISDDLPRLLTGDATRDETLAAAEHLRGCPDCQQELVSAVVAHASLTSAHRFAPRSAAVDELRTESAPAALPDMSAMFAQIREEAATQAQPAGKRRRLLIAVAAAAVVATAAGVTIAETVGPSPSHSVAQTLLLRPVPAHPDASAKVTIAGDRMHLDATSLPQLDADHQYEVWLVADAAGLRPLGYIGHDRTADLTVPASVMAQYTSVAISVQRNNQVSFSGDVVVRGTYG